MDLGIAGKQALVTGGTRGIGYAVGAVLAAEGAYVTLLGRDAPELRRRAARISSETGGVVSSVAVDTADENAVLAMFDALTAESGAPDILVNAAATPSMSPGLSEADLEHEIAVKVRGYLRLSRLAAVGMLERRWGRIINVAGIATRQTGSLVGSVRNAAVVAMTKNLADEFGPGGVNVTVVHPGWTRTERTDETLRQAAELAGVSPAELEAARAATISIGRMVTAAEVADVIAFLASPRSVAVNGDSVYAGGGVRGHIHY